MDTMCTPQFSHDLFHSHILPDLLSEYIHNLLVNNTRGWNPFLTLPLVSPNFYTSCCILYTSIFGPTDIDDQMTPSEIMREALAVSQDLWDRANQPPTRALPVDPWTQEDLKSPASLLQVYVCAATAKSYLNLDVLWPIELEHRRINGELDDAEDEDVHMAVNVVMHVDMNGYPPPPPSARGRRFKMRDDCMHRVFLPLTCAIELCDQIRPARLAYIVADYLAEIIPRYSTAPLILKYTQDLETYVTGEHRLNVDTLQFFIHQTLGLVDETSRLLRAMQHTGKLVHSFKRSSEIPLQVLRETNILHALDMVATIYWGEGTEWINNLTMEVKQKLLLSAGQFQR